MSTRAIHYSCDESTDQGLPANGLDETVHHLREHLRADLRAAHNLRVPAHARFPGPALAEHCWNRARVTQILLVQLCARCDFLENV